MTVACFKHFYLVTKLKKIQNGNDNCESFIPLARERITRQEGKEDQVNKSLDNLRQKWNNLRQNLQGTAEKCRKAELYLALCAEVYASL